MSLESEPLNILRAKALPAKIKKENIFFGAGIFLSFSSLVILGKEELIIYNIIINSIFIFAYLIWLIFKSEKITINGGILTYLCITMYCFMSILWTADADLTVSVSVRLFSAFASMVVFYNVFTKMNLFNYFFASLVFIVVVNLLVFLIEPGFIEIYERGSRFIGTMNNSNALSVIFVYNIFISINLLYGSRQIKKTVFLNINILLSLYMILMTISRKGFIAGSMMFFIYITTLPKYRYKWVNVSILLMLILYASFYYEKFSKIEEVTDILFERFEGVSAEETDSDASTEERIYFLRKGAAMFTEKPFFGWGANTFRSFHGDRYSHNNYIELLMGVGIFGFLLFYLIYTFIIKFIMVKLSGRERILFLFLFVFFFLNDFTTVSYYSRTHLIFLTYVMAYIKNISDEKLA